MLNYRVLWPISQENRRPPVSSFLCDHALNRPLCTILVALAAIVMGPRASLAQNAAARERQALLLIKVLSYDYALASRCGGALRVGIAYRADDQTSVAAGHEMFAALGRLAEQGFTVQRLPVRVSLLPVRDVADAAPSARRAGINALYIARGVPAPALGALLELARAVKWPTLSGLATHVQQGVAVGAVQRDGAFRILINRDAAVQQGSRFSAQIFKVAETVTGRR
jgi:hypothetical protein